MNITTRLTRRRKPNPLHDENRKLRAQLVGAAKAIGEVEKKYTTVSEHLAESQETVVSQQATIDDLTAERDDLHEQLAYLRERFAPQLADEANALAVAVPRMVRDISNPADQATEPIRVITLRQAHTPPDPAA
ncbi:hypothetical protein [Streptomyces sp. SID8352]|uniref:hypothetical protein n=1 Tax=Streptomyces sp. SID8352 TaxID=2690338 RepID=UPI00136C6593|nr:hypothetical protein [Streptomyces sp. SID8352]MYU20763.1 hypothetical protein [Streptomyces sp. SID8352]